MLCLPSVRDQRKGGKITAAIDRTDFGITYSNTLADGGLTIGNTVEIVTDFEILLPNPTPITLGPDAEDGPGIEQAK